MTIDPIRTALTKRPFQPFTVHLADGRQVRVEHHDFALVSPTGRILVVFQKDDSSNILDVMLASDLEYGPPPAAAQGA